ncbi:MAG: DUF4442 domain-containing protein [Flavobacteriales bacterium]|nr:DUF4442 domain-containing protein [Flavobacteriales bacterium]
MKLSSPITINRFILFKLPSAFFCGVRVKSFDGMSCKVSVKYRWINQNPFRSLYFAVQAMAAELSTGALMMHQIQNSKHKISMLVTENKAVFTKKAIGTIIFACSDGNRIRETIQKAIETMEGQEIWLQSIGIDEHGDQVSKMEFCWSIKVKQ